MVPLSDAVVVVVVVVLSVLPEEDEDEELVMISRFLSSDLKKRLNTSTTCLGISGRRIELKEMGSLVGEEGKRTMLEGQEDVEIMWIMSRSPPNRKEVVSSTIVI